MFAAIKGLLLLLSAIILAGFCVLNRHLIIIAFYPLPYELELPTYLLIIIMFGFGFSVAWLLASMRGIGRVRKLHRTEKRNGALSEEIARLKHQPLPKS
jgi:uncharacterized membrane protein YciS (DUF1049 family)